MVRCLLFCLSLVSMGVSAGDYERQLIEKRIKPIGKLNRGQADVPAAADALKPAPVKMEAGQATYQKYCSVCHNAGVAGAPKFRDEASWQSRIKLKDLTQLTQSAIKGLNAMPAKGTCMQCSDEQIEQAISYMLPKK